MVDDGIDNIFANNVHEQVVGDGGDGDKGKKKKSKPFNIFEFLESPIGLIVIGIIVIGGIIAIVLFLRKRR